jgi:hypothetical protein
MRKIAKRHEKRGQRKGEKLKRTTKEGTERDESNRTEERDAP